MLLFFFPSLLKLPNEGIRTLAEALKIYESSLHPTPFTLPESSLASRPSGSAELQLTATSATDRPPTSSASEAALVPRSSAVASPPSVELLSSLCSPPTALLIPRSSAVLSAGTRGVKFGLCQSFAGSEQVQGSSGSSLALVRCSGFMCTGSANGIMIWSIERRAIEGTILVDHFVPSGSSEEDCDSESGGCDSESDSDDDAGSVYPDDRLNGSMALAVPANLVISLCAWTDSLLFAGYSTGVVRLWDLGTGRCKRVLDGGGGAVGAILVHGEWLLSASGHDVRVWALSAGASSWRGKLLHGHTQDVVCLGAWRGKAFSAAREVLIRVWDLASGACERILSCHTREVVSFHTREVVSFVIHHDSDRLFSAAKDGTIRVWELGGSWSCSHILRIPDLPDLSESRDRIRTLPIPNLQLASIEHLLVYGKELVAISSSLASISTSEQPPEPSTPKPANPLSLLFSFDLESLAFTRAEGARLEVSGSVEAVYADEHGIWMSAGGGISFFPNAV